MGSRAYQTLQLRHGNQCYGPYATLSHCRCTIVRNRTTKSTLHPYMKDFDISSLCKTMRDAVIVTRNLRLKYPWIDAVCIVEDDSEDWDREIMKMADVYTPSAITIAASSSSGDGGCFYPRLNGPTAQSLWTMSDRSPTEKVSFRSHELAKYTLLVDDAPLNKKGWVMQERSLSRRSVHFTTDRLYWECQDTFLEGFTKGSAAFPRPVGGFQLASGNTKTRTPQEVSLMDFQWFSMLEWYTPSQLLFKSDRLPALAGLALT